MKKLFSKALLLCRFKFKLTQYLLLLLLLISNSVAAQNLALNKPVYVSSVESPGTNAKHFVNDGDFSTYWASEYNDNEWVIIDLQDEYNLGELKIHWEGSYSKRYAIEISLDNNNYETIRTFTKYDAGTDSINLDFIRLAGVTARYLKINCLERATVYGNAIYEIEVYGKPSNIALNKPVYVSSTSGYKPNSKTLLNDGDIDSYWASDLNENQIIIIDLKQQYNLDMGMIGWQEVPKKYSVEVSSDGKNYISDVTYTQNFPDPSNPNTQQTNLLNLNSYMGIRFVRITCLEKARTEYSYAIREFKISAKSFVESSNVALDKPSYVSSVESPGTNAKHFVNDGDFSTYWASEYNDNEWVIIDLQEDYILEELKIHWEGSYSKRYAIEISSDNSSYLTIYNEEYGSGGREDIDLNFETARYLKVSFKERATVYGNAIYEIEIFGQKIYKSTGYSFDNNGNTFEWKNFGLQDWAIENTKQTSYRDGIAIPWYYYEFSEGMYGVYTTTTPEGGEKLYNLSAVMGIDDNSAFNYPQYRKEFAPEGWRVPSVEDWEILENYLISNGYNYDGSTSENKISKAMASTTGWNYSNNEGGPGNDQSTNNSSGFNAIPVGRGPENYLEGNSTGFWAPIENNINYYNAGVSLNYNSPNLSFFYYSSDDAQSVRFVRDVQPLTASTNNYSKPLSVYPNPTTSIVTIEGGAVYNIEVYSLQGRKLMTQKGNSIDLSALSNAIYFIKATNTTNKQQQIYKVIKE